MQDLERQRKEQYLKQIAGFRQALLVDQAEIKAELEQKVEFASAESLMMAAAKFMLPVELILDIGCAFRPQPYINAKIHICCEPHEEYLNRLMVETIEEKKYVYLQADLAGVSRLFPIQSVDSIFLIDVVEHLEKATVIESLPKLKHIAKKQIVIFTPLGFMPQKHVPGQKDTWGMDGGEWMEHRSGWVPDDFPLTEGWRVIMCKAFHQQDAYGKKFAQAIGAFWAIWTRS